MRSLLPLLAIAMVTLVHAPCYASIETRRTPVVRAVERAIPAVVDISTKKRIRVSIAPFRFFRTPFDDLFFPPGLFEDTYVGTSLGSGVIVDPEGHIITNNHVVTYGRNQVADEIEVLLYKEDMPIRAEIVAREPDEDIAILRVIGDPPSQYLPFGDSSDLMIGETVIAIGYALRQSHTVTQGIISQLGRFVEDSYGNTLCNLIQTDADINPGNSGGPLINIDGELIGINTAIVTPSGGSVGIGFAIPINRVRKIYNYHVLGKPSLEYRLGIQVQTLLPHWRVALREQIAGFRDVKDLHGVLVMDVVPGSPASGVVERYDILQAINGYRINTVDDIRWDLVPDRTEPIELDLLRQGRAISARVSLDRPRTAGSEEWLGMELSELTPRYRRLLSLDWDLRGLLITGITRGSPADRARLETGDIITEIGPVSPGWRSGRLRVGSLADLERAKEWAAMGDAFRVYYYRYKPRGVVWALGSTIIVRGST